MPPHVDPHGQMVHILHQCEAGRGESAHHIKAAVKIGQVVAGKVIRQRTEQRAQKPCARGDNRALAKAQLRAPVAVSG
ncbi:hypothetical protein SDC9_69503 [bioreactor metagenome]|uniref:Uncharacterized protein n=1 Tax=bioreactor metagenome TaxID=1076179 RepID=A0A644Y524_9ZZZZ